MKFPIKVLLAVTVLAMSTLACIESTDVTELKPTVDSLVNRVDNLDGGVGDQGEASPSELGTPDAEFTLITASEGTNLVFKGVGGDIDGETNPTLVVSPGDVVQVTLVNGMATEHDLAVEGYNVSTGSVLQLNEKKVVTFVADQEGVFAYFCTIAGHRAAGMEGKIQVGEASSAATAESIVRNPSDLPAPRTSSAPELVQVQLVAQEVEGQLADGATYTYFTFNGKVPGPFIRAQVGDTIEVTLVNETENSFTHSIDLHAVNGPGGGSVLTQVDPGETKVFTFKALTPGIFVYHCATPSVPHHIASGMYGMILIEPEGGLPPVDHEFYVMQGEIYTTEPYGSEGQLTFSHEKLMDEQPEYFVFNGAANALTTEENRLNANVGDTVRIFFGVGGPNFTSSFHVIGEIFDRVYPFGSFTSPNLTDVQTISVAPGSAWIVELTTNVPGDYILVDHAISRIERGLVGILHVEGEENPAIYHEGPATP